MTPSSLLFFSTTILGTFIALSSNNWLYLWAGMELNLLSFIPLISHSQLLQETEASVKYFIIQALGSSLMLTAGTLSWAHMMKEPFNMTIVSLILITSMMIKLGLAPYHQWLPSVMSSMNWTMCLILSTWQKLSPLLILATCTPHYSFYLMMIPATISAIVGGMGGMNQSQLRAILAYSSIGHMGWMVAAMYLELNLFIVYLTIYIIITTSLMVAMIQINKIHSNFNNSMLTIPVPFFFMMMVILFSLGGLPPLLGFFPKWFIIHTMSSKALLISLMVLITGSLMNLFYYFSMVFNFTMLVKNTKLHFNTPMYLTMFVTMMSTMSPIIMYM